MVSDHGQSQDESPWSSASKRRSSDSSSNFSLYIGVQLGDRASFSHNETFCRSLCPAASLMSLVSWARRVSVLKANTGHASS